MNEPIDPLLIDRMLYIGKQLKCSNRSYAKSDSSMKKSHLYSRTERLRFEKRRDVCQEEMAEYLLKLREVINICITQYNESTKEA